MRYSIVAEIYDAMEGTDKRLELIDLLAKLFISTPIKTLEKVIYLTQGKLYPDFKGIEIGVADRLAMRTIAQTVGISLQSVEEQYRKSGDIGLVVEELLKTKTQLTLYTEPLTVERVYHTLDKIAKTSGPGSLDIKLRYLSSILSDASPKEAKHILRTVTGKLRLGIADYTVLDALAVAFTGHKANRPDLEMAYNITSDLGAIAKAVAVDGLNGVHRFQIQLGKPIRPMLAERLESVSEILRKMGGNCSAEYKLDGERLQIHKGEKEVCLFSRRLEDITSHYPDVVKLSKKHIKVKSCIMEAEVVAINESTGDYLPFQELMHRRRKYRIKEALEKYPIALYFFDILYLDGKDCTHLSYTDRRRILQRAVSIGEKVKIVPALISKKERDIEKFMEAAITDGCEGLLIKDLNSTYRAGAREFAWIKLKREYKSELRDAIDLVIVGAFYGKGRRAGQYGAFLLAAYDKDLDTFRTITKVGTGFTDKDLEVFSKLLRPYEIEYRQVRVDSKIEADIWFMLKVVIEVKASEITLSPIHTCGMNVIRKGSGLALRFPKYAGKIRDDKGAEDATTNAEIIRMYRAQLKKMEDQTMSEETTSEIMNPR